MDASLFQLAMVVLIGMVPSMVHGMPWKTAATAVELAAAVSDGTAHISVTDHLDLSSLTQYTDTGLTATAEDTHTYLFHSPSGLQSLRGNCSAPPPADASGRAADELVPGQCVLMVTAGLLRVDSESQRDATQLWIDNLHIHYIRASPATLLSWSPEDIGTLWLTNTTLAGGGLAAGLFVDENSNAFVADCSFQDNSGFAVQTRSLDEFSPSEAALERCTFAGTFALDDVSAVIMAFGESAAVRAQGCIFEDNDADTFTSDAYNTQPSVIYTDAAGLTVAPHSQGSLLPLANAPASLTRLNNDHPAFVTLRAEANNAAAAEGQAGSSGRGEVDSQATTMQGCQCRNGAAANDSDSSGDARQLATLQTQSEEEADSISAQDKSAPVSGSVGVLGVGAIIGIAVSAVVVMLLALVAAFLLGMRQQRRNDHAAADRAQVC